MRAALAASTVTPGSTAPPSSRTTPAIVPLDASCAQAIAGTDRSSSTTTTAIDRGMPSSLFTVARSLAILSAEFNALTLTAAAAPHTFARMLKPRAPRFHASLAVLLLLTFAASAAFAQGTWKNVAPFPEPREELLGSTAGGKLYVFAGLIPLWKPAGVVYEYDPAGDKWTKKKPMALPAHHVALASYNNKIYAFGGF